jgi:hypothetical protein
MSNLHLLVGERQKYESSAAIQACNDFLRLGPGRTLTDLHRRYTQCHQSTPPTESYDTLKQWSSRYGWASRAEAWDAGAEERKTQAYDQAMKSGLALDYERVKELKELANFLIDQVYEQGPDGTFHNVWVPDVKSVGAGDYVEIVDIERFNSGLIQQLRSTLDDLAKETGGRVKKQEISGPDGDPVQIVIDR